MKEGMVSATNRITQFDLHRSIPIVSLGACGKLPCPSNQVAVHHAIHC